MINERYVNKYCIEEQIHLIENYELAINDKTQTWDCHHRKETDENKTANQLIEENLYYNRPADELIFLNKAEHNSLHNKGRTSPMKGKKHSCETKAKIADAKKGKTLSEEHIAKLSVSHQGKPGPNKGKTFSTETKQKMSASLKGKPKKKLKWLTPTGEIVEMSGHAKRFHKDWILIGE